MTAYARASQTESGAWRFQALINHLDGVATRAGAFGASFGAEALAELAGRWHDLGKYAGDFQRYLLNANGLDADTEDAGIADSGRVDHSAAGALWAIEQAGAVGRILAQLIAAHHAGLYDASDLQARLQRARDGGRLEAALQASPPEQILRQTIPNFPQVPGTRAQPPEPLAYSLWLRLLFSCLVDADVLDSEAFGDPAAARLRSNYPSLAELKPRFDTHMATFKADTPVRQLRAQVLADCRARAESPIGLFTLTVPTGGGKTLSSLAFALEHALRHGLKRVIYVIPYTSIIEQTADVFRAIFGEAVVEHHSNFETERETQRSRLATENWGAPIVVTTSVQFFESLFAARTSRCRKLHNILDSVVVIDEAQMLPPDFLQPIVDTIRLLSSHYRTSIVLSTATQPALTTRERFGEHFRGLQPATELVSDPDRLYRALKRVDVELPVDLQQPRSWESLATEVGQEPCVLVIVNSRADARELYRLLPRGTLHLSALMCGAHRSDVIRHIRERLQQRREDASAPPLRVVSTQLVEAGVDLDFPVVYRALAGLDSIAQAGGRCNREGLQERGRVVVFVPPRPPHAGLLKLALHACIGVLHGEQGDPLRRDLFTRYFESLYRDCQLDAKGIVNLLKPDNTAGVAGLRRAAELFKLIDDTQSPVLVPYRRHPEDQRFQQLVAALRSQNGQGGVLRKLQRYSVGLSRWDFERQQRSGEIREIFPGVWELISEAQYDPNLGLLVEGPDPNVVLMV